MPQENQTFASALTIRSAVLLFAAISLPATVSVFATYPYGNANSGALAAFAATITISLVLICFATALAILRTSVLRPVEALQKAARANEKARIETAVLHAVEADHATLYLNNDGHVERVNPVMCKVLALPEIAIQGSSLETILVRSEPSEDVTGSVLSGKTRLGKFRFCCRGGTVAVIEGTFSRLPGSSGNPDKFIFLGRDITGAENALEEDRARDTQAASVQDKAVDALRLGLRQLSNCDLTVSLGTPFLGKYEDLRQDYNRTVSNLSKILQDIIENAENIRNEARDISSTADTLSRRTEKTAATLEQTAASLDELTVSVKSAAEGAVQADKVVAEAKVNAEQSGNVVLETVAAMDKIAASSDKITSIIKVIDDIAFQTNLLALNAGVEAARAGDAGKGFAVVASEVRALAQRSSGAAREISDLIADSGANVKRGVELVGKTGTTLKQIVESVSDISELMSEIALSSRQQSLGLAEINSAVNELDQAAQQNAARLEETTAASEALTNQANALVQLVSPFRTEGQKMGRAKRPTRDKDKGRSPTDDHKPNILTASLARGVGTPVTAALKADAETGWEDF
tara:strand:+ start:212 stop:1948 length:1737 start_codon:yes stop_codon:yes gene_type:complete